jgi:hypothetical protein
MNGKAFPLFLILLLLFGIADDWVANLTEVASEDSLAAADNTYLPGVRGGRPEHDPVEPRPAPDGPRLRAAGLAYLSSPLPRTAWSPGPVLFGPDSLYLLMSLQP